MAPEQTLFYGNFCYLTLSSVQGLKLCLQFVGNCGSRAEVFSSQFFLPDSVERFIKAEGFEFGCVGCCLPVGSAMARKVLFVRWPPDFSIT